ncbi:hypothetical protein Trydic_g20937 [Trypoxylus dichotomus]
MWLQHDYCSAHYSVVAHEVFDRDSWIGRAGPISWLAKSPDFLWGFMKDKAVQEVPRTPENMIERIRNACAHITRDVLLSYVRAFETRIDGCTAI